MTVDISVDGSPPQAMSRLCEGEPVFANVFFTSDPLAEINHTVVVTNRGDRSTPFQFDRADIQANSVPTLWQPLQTNGLSVSLTPMVVATPTPAGVLTTQKTGMQASRSSKATSSSGRRST